MLASRGPALVSRGSARDARRDGRDQLDEGHGDDQLRVVLVQAQPGGVASEEAAGERRLGEHEDGVDRGHSAQAAHGQAPGS